jgi:hypothetical protein
VTTAEFRANPELVKSLRSILEADVMKLWLEAMEEQSPVNFLPTPDVTPHFAHIQLGQQTGWEQFLQTFKSGGQQPEGPTTEPEQSYLPPEEPET